jgi:hypothetical protein
VVQGRRIDFTASLSGLALLGKPENEIPRVADAYDQEQDHRAMPRLKDPNGPSRHIPSAATISRVDGHPPSALCEAYPGD